MNSSTKTDITGDSYATDRAAIIWNDNIAASTTIMSLISASGTTLTFISTTSLGVLEVSTVSMVSTDSSTLIFAFTDQDNGDFGTTKKITLSGDTVSTIGSSEVFASSDVDVTLASRKAMAEISTDKLVICYRDAAASNNGKCIIGDIQAAGAAATSRRRLIIIQDE